MIRKFALIIFIASSLCNLAYSQEYKSNAFDVLYHGSPNSNIEILEPRQLNVRDNAEGAVIFASSSIKVASCFLFPWDDTWVNMSVSNDGKDDFKVTLVISDHAEFVKRDKGGAIYLVPSKDFIFDKNKGLGIYEWISKNKTIPYGKIIFSSSSEAMKKLGVKVYFVSPKQFEDYLELPGEKQQPFLNAINQSVND